MAEENDDERTFLLLAGGTEPAPPALSAKDRLMAAILAERYLPFCGELARWFDLGFGDMRALLARIDDPAAWKRGVPPLEGSMDFRPGPALLPLHGGFVRMQSGMRVPPHRHVDREVTIVIAGELSDGEGRVHGPGEAVEMAVGSVHSLGVPEGKEALVAILHGRIELLGA
jgi:hypothetical protein